MSNKNRITNLLLEHATKMASQKAASEGSPDRLNSTDAAGGIQSPTAATPTKDTALADLVVTPPDGAVRTSAEEPAGAPDRLTSADAAGGIQSPVAATPKKDSGEEELKRGMPADGMVNKSARISALADVIKKARGGAGAATQEAPLVSPTQNLDTDTLAKMASAMLSTDEGVRTAFDLLEKQAGAAEARSQIEQAIRASDNVSEDNMIKKAAFDDVVNIAQDVHQGLDNAGVTEDDCAAIIKQAALHQSRLDEYEHPLLKQAYAQGIDDAALMAGAEEAAGAEGALPMDEALPMGGEDLGEEDVIELLKEMIEAGVVSEEEVVAAISADQGGEEIPAEAALAEEAPAV